ncbi:hypothetical protein [Moraxella lacunata]
MPKLLWFKSAHSSIAQVQKSLVDCLDIKFINVFCGNCDGG